jgi:hypothetical protein
MLVMSFFILFQFALLYKGMIRGFCFSLTGLKSNSVYTISWSEIPGNQEKPLKTTQIIQKEEENW